MDQVGAGVGHAEDGENLRAAGYDHQGAGPVVLVGEAAVVNFNRWEPGGDSFSFRDVAVIAVNIAQTVLDFGDDDVQGLLGSFLRNDHQRGLIGCAHGDYGVGQHLVCIGD